jgi:two-component system, NtrC family, response regulator
MQKLYKVLIVDDHEYVSHYLKSLLSADKGFECETAETHKRAMSVCKENGIDLVIYDLHLPDANGFEGLNELRDKYSYLPIIVFTAHQDKLDRIRAFKRGVQAYFIKPHVDAEQFYDAIYTAMAKQEYDNRMQRRIQELEKRFNWKLKLGWVGTCVLGLFELIKGLIELSR